VKVITVRATEFAPAQKAAAAGSVQALSVSAPAAKTKFLDFNARQQNNGRTVGEMTFTDPNATLVVDPDLKGAMVVSVVR